MAMLRHRNAGRDQTSARLLVSSRSLDDLLYADELMLDSAEAGVTVQITLTRSQPPDWTGYARRVDMTCCASSGRRGRSPAHVRLRADPVRRACRGRARDARAPAEQIHAERFGPSGG